MKQTKNNRDILSFLQKLEETETPIIVEGKNDRAALEQLGLHQIITLDKKPIFKIIEHLLTANIREIAILTDLDSEGKKLYRKLNHECSQRGIRVNNQLRHFLLKETTLGQIEGLATFMKHQQL